MLSSTVFSTTQGFPHLESPGFFFLKIPGPGKISLKITHFFGSNGKQAEIVNVPVCVDFYFYLFLKTTTVNILLMLVSAMDYTPNVVSKRCLFFISKHSWAPKRSWKISHGGSWKVLDFFQ